METLNLTRNGSISLTGKLSKCPRSAGQSEGKNADCNGELEGAEEERDEPSTTKHSRVWKN